MFSQKSLLRATFTQSRRYTTNSALYSSVHNATRHNYYPHLELKDKVPKLPVPTLEQTVTQYQQILHPILNNSQYERATKYIQEFLNVQGPPLQNELLRLDSEVETSYIEGLWDTMYLELRCPNPINVNPVFQINFPAQDSQELTAAKLIAASTQFAQMIHDGRIPVDTVGKDRQPLCMTQYRNFFGTARVPQPARDELHKYIGSKHVLIIANGQFFQLNVLDEDNKPIKPEVLHQNLLRIQQESRALNATECIGVLTADDRTVWAGIRKHFKQLDQKNVKFLDVVDSSLFVTVLDEAPANTKKELQELLIAGHDRWFDKLQVIVTKNSLVGVNMEHAPYDGATLLTYAQYVTGHNFAPQDYSSAQSTTHKVVDYKTDTSLVTSVDNAKKALDAFATITDHEVLEFKGYGKRGIVANKVSPDSYLQMAFQLAYYDLAGKPGSTYESAMTKRFYHGRTETLRTVSDESVRFTKRMRDASVSVADKQNALRAAAAAHGERMKLAQQGMGVDRHLYALHALSKLRQQRFSGFDVPEIFTDESYSIMKTDMLSTSNCSSPAVGLFGFGATSAHGWGLGYIINNDDIIVGITNYDGRSQEYKQALEKSLNDMNALMQQQA